MKEGIPFVLVRWRLPVYYTIIKEPNEFLRHHCMNI